MTKAFLLNSERQIVQIGNKIFYLQEGKVETVQANRKGIFHECEAYIDVPMKSEDGAKLAINLIEQRHRR